MRGMRRTIASLFASLVLAGVAVAAPPTTAPAAAPAATPSPGRPRTLASLRAAAVRSGARLLALSGTAAMDAGLRRVRTYVAYPDSALAVSHRDVTGGVTVHELFDIASDQSEPPEVREEAANAIIAERARALDPDLSAEGRRSARPRARFSLRVVKSINDPDLVTRSLANTVLLGLWPAAREAPEIKAFEPRKRETWGSARAAWTRFLGG